MAELTAPTASGNLGTLQHLLTRVDLEAGEVEDLRTCVRRAVSGPVLMLPRTERFIAGQPPQVGWVLDLSEQGIGFLSDQPLVAGTMWMMDLEALAGTPTRLIVRVIYCHQILKNTFRIGGIFVAQPA